MRTIELHRSVTESNDRDAEVLRQELREKGVLLINLMSAAGSGKTTLLSRIIRDLSDKLRIAVLEADIEASVDAETIEALSGKQAQIKWVNDILVDSRKVCGILTEASVDCENGMMRHVIIGIGVNTHVPKADFPEELKSIAGAAFGAENIPELLLLFC